MDYGVIVSKKVLKKEMERLGYFPAVAYGTNDPEFCRSNEFIVDGEVEFEPVSFDRFWRLVRKLDREIREADGELWIGYKIRYEPRIITGKERKTPMPVEKKPHKKGRFSKMFGPRL